MFQRLVSQALLSLTPLASESGRSWVPPTTSKDHMFTSQVVLASDIASSENSLVQWNEPFAQFDTVLGIPLLVTGLSVVSLAVQLATRAGRRKSVATTVASPPPFDDAVRDRAADGDVVLKWTCFVSQRRGTTIFALNLSRILSCLALLGLSLWTAGIYAYLPRQPEHDNVQPDTVARFTVSLVPLAPCVIYAYASILSAAATFTTSATKLWVAHVNAVLLPIWIVFIYRDVLPLATYTLSPADAAEGDIIWVKIFALTYAAVIVPLVIPRQYTPADPKDSEHEPSPEQTASLLSLLLYSWLDKTVSDACHTEHLRIDQLPPLADDNKAEILVKEGFPELSPFEEKNKDRHVIWGFVKIFQIDLVLMAVLLLFNTAFQFANPLAVQYLLSYIESDGEGAWVRPWVWVLWLFLGPLLDSISISYYYLFSMRALVRIEALVTQLVFEHALRMRVKAETGTSPADGKAAEGRNVQGKINNLITSDLAAIGFGREILAPFLKSPTLLIGCIVYLYALLGWSALVGMSVVIILLPLPGILATQVRKVQAAKMKKTDARVQTVTETMGVIRMIKLFGWELRILDQLNERRDEELQLDKKSKLLDLTNSAVNYVIPLLTMIVTYMTYTMVMKQDLTASRVFASMTVFTMFSRTIRQTFNFTPVLMRSKVALDRVDEFLHQTELLDDFSAPAGSALSHASLFSAVPTADCIGFRDVCFTWCKDTELPSTPGSGSRSFKLRIEGELLFRNGGINLIVGPTGSGKTSMLMALLGEMHYIPEGPNSFYQLPRAGGVAYAAQESWVQNETIRDNILFGSPYERERYDQVIDQCGLRRDLDLFVAGDLTEVGEKGITLSGGQKARITLARAIYSRADILLLDDILAALDVHTAQWVVSKCLKGNLVRGRTVLLVTHNLAMTKGLADFVVALGSNGKVQSQGSMSKALAHDYKLTEEPAQIDQMDDAVDDDGLGQATTRKAAGKLIVEEEVAVGHVGWDAMRFYLASLGGRHPWFFWVSFMGFLTVSSSLDNFQVWFLGYWAQQYETHDASEVRAPYYLGIYTLILLVSVLFYYTSQGTFILGALRGSRSMHRYLTSSVLGTTLRWLDKTPTSRIVARCTQDIQAVDLPIPSFLGEFLNYSMSMLLKVGVIVAMSPVFIVPAAVITGAGGWIGRVYMKAQLSVKRERSNAQAPVLGHFGAAFAGLVSIRAFGAQNAFREESYKRINCYSRVSVAFWALNRWAFIRIDALGAIFTGALAGYLLYSGSASASSTGFSLNMAVAFSGMILWWVRMLNQLEVNGNSLERIKQYLQIEQEPKPSLSGVPPAYWPASGDLKVENLSARYSPDGPEVLQKLTFHIKSGERVGIVGRTGSGKSSLTLSLLRCIITTGKVYYDGIDTESINLDALRSSITIIPQMPELLSGTLRQNLDPFHQFDDAQLNESLRSAGLFSLQHDLEDSDSKITLDTPIASGGGNLSVGQRQILALARAILRQSKLLILDEATSAIDYATDAVIQNTLRKELDNGVTVLTVAHRLHTVMDADRIMVLDAGRIVEFGRPNELLATKKSLLRALVEESGDREALYSMAKARLT